jgi:hypothetical protein
MKRVLRVILFSAAGLLAAASADAQIGQSRCADCHFANPTAPRRDHLEEWDRSPHGRNNIGCEKCHGGNDRVFDKLPAHVGIIPAVDRFSPVNRRNLPTTCGRCHVGPFVAFQESTHYKLLQAGNENGPTCSTCHGDADGRLLSPKELASRCDACHGPKGVAPREGRSLEARRQYEGVKVVREELKLVQSLIKRVTDKPRRAALTEAYDQAQVPVTRALNAGHKFVYDELRDYLATAQERVEALLTKLANR